MISGHLMHYLSCFFVILKHNHTNLILLCAFSTAIISKSVLGTQWTLKNRQKSIFGPTVIKLWENTLYYACYQNIHITQNWSLPTKCTLWQPGSHIIHSIMTVRGVYSVKILKTFPPAFPSPLEKLPHSAWLLHSKILCENPILTGMKCSLEREGGLAPEYTSLSETPCFLLYFYSKK